MFHAALEIPHPIPYQGSKRLIAPTILRYFPRDCDTLYEPFAGSAAVSLAVSHAGVAARFAISDTNPALIRLWQDIFADPETIAAEYEALWRAQLGREKAFYNDVRARFNKEGGSDRFLYLLARCVKASVRYNAYGEFNQGPDNRRKGCKPATMRYHLTGASRLLAGKTRTFCGDYREATRSAQPGDLIYMDPPYQGVCGSRDPRYFQEVRFAEFVEALADMNARGLSFIVSYDGRNSVRSYGRPLPERLDLTHIEVYAGRSSQATLLGIHSHTVESLYVSSALMARLPHVPDIATLPLEVAM